MSLKPNFSPTPMLECGCDEAGRGCLAGPVCAAAVIFPYGYNNEEINDSKQLTEKKRNALREIILRDALAYAITEVSPADIDKMNILHASIHAMNLAIEQLSVKPELILVDGNRFTDRWHIPYRCIVKGDATYLSIAAASILAKTHRDALMTRLADEFPDYDWKNNKGYPELHDMGTKLIVSVWPTINERSENYGYMRDNNMLIRTVRGSDRVFDFYGPQAEIDATNPETRKFVFSKLKENYLDNGVDGLWFDEAEPEIHPEHFDNLLLHEGRGDETGLIYPYRYAQMAYEGFAAMGVTPVTLIRAAYTGSQKFGALVWSGDIPSTFESLEQQVKAGLNMSMCGIPWWNTDIGGFWGADTRSDEFRELIVRWFQYGVFCPVMRLHGARIRHGEKKRDVKEPTGDPNEIWSFGEENFEILKNLILLRERLRPYIEEQMKIASEKGYPVMRPMFFEYPDDETCYETGEQYMFGSDILFAPVVRRGQREKEVYLPEGEWIFTNTGEQYGPGFHKVKCDIHEFTAFVKKGAGVLEAFDNKQ